VSIFDVLEDLKIQVPETFIEKAREDMATKGIPLMEFEVVALLENRAKIDDAEAVLEVYAPSGKITEIGGYQPLQFKGLERLRQRWCVGSWLIHEVGRYEIRVKVRELGGKDAKEVAALPLTISLNTV